MDKEKWDKLKKLKPAEPATPSPPGKRGGYVKAKYAAIQEAYEKMEETNQEEKK